MIQIFAGLFVIVVAAAIFFGRSSGEKATPAVTTSAVEKKSPQIGVKVLEKDREPVQQETAPPLIVEKKRKGETGGILVIVLDDAGYTKANFEAITEISQPITLAVLPGLKYSRSACEFARDNGLGVILHIPMEPQAEQWAREKNTIMAGMGPDEVNHIIGAALDTVPFALGVSNHMGSRATGDKEAATSLMMALERRNLFFLDSFTTASTVCESTAALYDVPYYRRDIFLDNQAEISYIKERLAEAANIALKKGSAVAIGHDRKNTVAAIKEYLPELKKKGIRLTTLKEISPR